MKIFEFNTILIIQKILIDLTEKMMKMLKILIHTLKF